MYGRGAGLSGAGTTAAGVALLPNTGGNLALTILSITTITVGVLVTASFVLTRIAERLYR